MFFTKPIAFKDALKLRAVKTLLPTQLSSKDLAQLAADLLERSLFSARTTFATYLQALDDRVNKLIAGATDQATVRLELKQALDALDYQPAPEERGTITDLSSDTRLNLVIKTNTEMAQGYGYWQQGQDPVLLDAFPCSELFRAEDRKEKRTWRERWRGAGGEVFAGQAPGLPIEEGFSEGRFIARKDDPVWAGISNFGTPYPPFDFNSGLEVRDVDRAEAVALGVIAMEDNIEPQQRDFENDLTATPDVRDPQLRDALLASLGPDYEFDAAGVLKKSEG